MGISLVTYSGSTVTAQDDALVYEAALRKSGILYGCAVTISNATTLHIAAGHGVIAGRKFTVDATDITVGLAPSGTLKGRLYIQLDLSNNDTPISFKIETGASLTAPVQTANVNVVNGIWEYNIATFTVSTSTISALVDVAPTYGSVAKTLAAGNTSVTFDVPTYGNYLIDFYTSTGINYNAIAYGTGTVTLQFEAQANNITVSMNIREA